MVEISRELLGKAVVKIPRIDHLLLLQDKFLLLHLIHGRETLPRE